MMKKRLAKNARKVDRFLINFLKKQKTSLLVKPMKYGVISGGKKIRSTIIFDTGKIFNIKEADKLEIIEQPIIEIVDGINNRTEKFKRISGIYLTDISFEKTSTQKIKRGFLNNINLDKYEKIK